MIAVLAAAVGLLFGAEAFAGRGDAPLAITLEHDPGEAPMHVCVVLLGVEGAATVDLARYGRFTDGTFALGAAVPRAEPGQLPGDEAQRRTDAALDLVRPSLAPDDGSCRHEAECAPTLTLPAQPFVGRAGASETTLATRIGCATNVRPVSGGSGSVEPSVLVLYLDFEDPGNVKPAIDRLRLDGSVVRIDLGVQGQRVDADSLMIVAGVAGGHYATPAQATYLATDGRLTLPIAPRCRRHLVQLPPIHGASARSAAVRYLVDDVERTRCAAPISGDARIDVPLPFAPGSRDNRVQVTVGEPGTDEYGVFDARWTSQRAPPVLDASASAVSFAWERSCLWPRSVAVTCPGRLRWVTDVRHTAEERPCPHASLPQVGADCGDGELVDDACVYRCPATDDGPVGLRFSLPTPVQFERGPGIDRFTDTLDYLGQRLDGWVPPAERVVDADLTCWDPHDIGGQPWPRRPELTERRFGDTPKEIRVRSPDGRTVHVLPSAEGNRRVAVPGLACPDRLTYRIIADRPHLEASATVRGGRLLFERPARTARLYGMSSGVATTLLAPWYAVDKEVDNPWRIEPALMLSWALWFRPGETGIPYRNVVRAVWFEWFQLTYLLSPQQYVPVQAGRINPATTEELLYNRLMVTFTPFLNASRRISVGLGGGEVTGFNTLASDTTVGAVRTTWTAHGEVRFAPRDIRFQVAGALRYMPDVLYVYRTDYEGAVVETVAPGRKVGFELGVRFGP